MRHRSSPWLRAVRVTLAGALLTLGAQAAQAQVADWYRGEVVNAGVATPGSLELAIYTRTDSSIGGWLAIGPPLGGSGPVAVLLDRPDSLYLYSVSASGDTIVWGSATRSGALGGDYWIRGGPYAGQTGTWRLAPVPHLSAGALLVLGLGLGGLVVLLVAAVAHRMEPRWWAWRLPQPLQPTTPDEARDFTTLGGWLQLIVIGHVILSLGILTTLAEYRTTLGNSWMLGIVAPDLRGALFLEITTLWLQVLGAALGVVLIVRRARMTPAFYSLYLPLVGGLAIANWVQSDNLGAQLGAAFGAAAKDMQKELAASGTENGRAVVYSIIWTLYWVKSRRVRLFFGQQGSTGPDVPVTSGEAGAASIAVPAGEPVGVASAPSLAPAPREDLTPSA